MKEGSLNIYITPKNEKFLREYHQKWGRSMSGLVNDLLEGAIESHESIFPGERIIPEKEYQREIRKIGRDTFNKSS